MSSLPDIWRWVCLATVLLIAVQNDWRFGRIPNKALLAGLLGAVVAVALDGFWGTSGLWPALSAAALGLSGGFLLSLPLYLLRLLGAGDVKLLAVVGAFLGWPAIGPVLLLALLLNGLASIGIALYRGVLRRVLANVWQSVVRATFWVSSGGAVRQAVHVEASGYRMPHALGVALAVLVYVNPRWLDWVRG